MKRFGVLSGFIIVTAIAFAIMGPTPGSGKVLGMPVLGVAEPFDGMQVSDVVEAGPAWLQVGMGTGVLVVGIGGAGVVTYSVYGVGVLFATGQAAAGLFAIGQFALGLFLVICQFGAGLTGIGQGVAGVRVAGGTLGGDGKALLRRLQDDAEKILAFTSR